MTGCIGVVWLQPRDGRKGHETMRVLIADDDLTTRTLLSSMLAQAGHEVLEASGGEESWAMMQRPDAPRLAILDWLMPDLDGLEVVRRIRALKSDQPPYILMLTVKGQKSDIVAGLESGADDYLPKPFDPGELRARVEVGRRMLDLQAQLNAQIGDLRLALSHIKTLQGILPICMHCKKIRNDAGYWEQVEDYVTRHSEALFSHGVCPECLKQYTF